MNERATNQFFFSLNVLTIKKGTQPCVAHEIIELNPHSGNTTISTAVPFPQADSSCKHILHVLPGYRVTIILSFLSKLPA